MDESEDSIAGGKTAFLLIIKQNKQKQPRRGKTNWQEGQDRTGQGRAGQGWAGLGWAGLDKAGHKTDNEPTRNVESSLVSVALHISG